MMSVFSQEHLIFMTNKEALHLRGNEHRSIMYLMTEFSIIFFFVRQALLPKYAIYEIIRTNEKLHPNAYLWS